MAEEKVCPCHKTKVRDPKEYKDLLNRLSTSKITMLSHIAYYVHGGERCVLSGYIDTGSRSECSTE